MKTTKNLDRATLREINSKIEEKANEVLAEYGMGVDSKRGTYGGAGGGGSVKLTFSQRDESGESLAGRCNWNDWAGLGNDLKAEWFGATFEHGGSIYRISGYNGRARKRPVETVREDNGKIYVWPADAIVRFFAFGKLKISK